MSFSRLAKRDMKACALFTNPTNAGFGDCSGSFSQMSSSLSAGILLLILFLIFLFLLFFSPDDGIGEG